VNDKGQKFQKNAWFGLKGENSLHTAMAKTVGLPLGIASKLILNACISQKGLLLPLQEEIYQPVLKELSGFGIEFQQTTLPL
jgi:saccharopine dehydrogenase (NADP+, L-glutamate forming)